MTDKPVFPLENPRLLEDGSLFKQHPGMTVRELAAISIIQGLMASEPFDVAYKTEVVVDRAVEITDALLDRLQKGRDA